MITIDPRFLSAVDWAARTTLLLAPYGTIPILRSEEDWPNWAAAVITLPALSGLKPPKPRSFSNWREWAAQLNQDLNLLN